MDIYEHEFKLDIRCSDREKILIDLINDFFLVNKGGSKCKTYEYTIYPSWKVENYKPFLENIEISTLDFYQNLIFRDKIIYGNEHRDEIEKENDITKMIKILNSALEDELIFDECLRLIVKPPKNNIWGLSELLEKLWNIVWTKNKGNQLGIIWRITEPNVLEISQIRFCDLDLVIEFGTIFKDIGYIVMKQISKEKIIFDSRYRSVCFKCKERELAKVYLEKMTEKFLY